MALSKIKTGSIADSAVTPAKLADSAVTTAKLGTDAVETAKVKDLNVTAGKLAATQDLSSKTITLPAAWNPSLSSTGKALIMGF